MVTTNHLPLSYTVLEDSDTSMAHDIFTLHEDQVFGKAVAEPHHDIVIDTGATTSTSDPSNLINRRPVAPVHLTGFH